MGTKIYVNAQKLSGDKAETGKAYQFSRSGDAYQKTERGNFVRVGPPKMRKKDRLRHKRNMEAVRQASALEQAVDQAVERQMVNV